MKIRSTLFIGFLFFVSSCSVDNERLPDESIAELEIGPVLRSAIVHTSYNQAAMPGRNSGLIMQYLEYFQSCWNLDNFGFSDRTMGVFWKEDLYGGSLKAANELLDLAIKQENKEAQAIAYIIFAIEYGNTTTSFGDIPFSEALQGSEGIVKPVLDTQEEVYEGIINYLNEAISILSNNTSSQLASADLVHSGNMANWKMLAHGLRARYNNHLALKDAQLYSSILSDIENSYKSHQDQSKFNFAAIGLEHPMKKFQTERPSTMKGGSTFYNQLVERNDPRLSNYFSKKDDHINIQDGGIELYWISDNTSMPWLSYTELQFIKTEILVKTNQSDELITLALTSAIESSMAQMSMNIEDHLGFIAQRSDITTLTKEEKIKHIIGEAYYSFYGYAWQENWSNYRRTGYPDLMIMGGVSEINPSGVLPKRYLYPVQVMELNEENFETAKANQNGALLDEPLWIFSD